MHKKACTECQRRKQRCSREWPCIHCRARNIPHRCQFISHSADERRINSEREYDLNKPDGRTPHHHESKPRSDQFMDVVPTPPLDCETLFHPILAHHRITEIDSKSVTLEHEVAKAVQVIPPRYLCDTLIDNFVNNVNYIYYSTYPPVFLTRYAEWWTLRGRIKDPSLTCLILRICAYSAQYLSNKAIALLETNLAEDIRTLSERFHIAAEKLSSCIETGTGGLTHVEQLFLAAPWYKSECKFKETWHALGRAIREAQEIRLYQDDPRNPTDNLETELRRRMWSLLYLWDRQLSNWLNRPLLINQQGLSLTLPKCDSEIFGKADIPSPFAVNKIMCGLFIKTGERLNVHQTSESYQTILSDLKTWIDAFPPVFSLSKPDLRYDEDHPFVRQQRCCLHAMAYKFKMDLLKRFMFQGGLSSVTWTHQYGLKIEAIETCWKAVSIAHQLFEVMFPVNAKAYVVSCLGFEAGVNLAAGILHDDDSHYPLYGNRCIAAIQTVLEMLKALKDHTRLGTITYGILQSIIWSLPRSDPISAALCTHWPYDKAIALTQARQDTTTIPDTSEMMYSDRDHGSSTNLTSSTQSRINTDSSNIEIQDLLSENQQYVPTFSDFEAMNFGGLEEVWDPDELNLSAYENTDGRLQFRAPREEF